MAKKTDEGSLILIAIVVIIAIIYYVILWILANWIPILIVVILIGSIYLIIQWQIDQTKKKQEALNIVRKKEQAEKRAEFEAKQRKDEEDKRIEFEKQIREFEKQQIKLGLLKFVDRFGGTKWGFPHEIELWKKEDDAEKIKDLLITKIVDTINCFKPIKIWENEDGYHKELLGYLRHDYPDIKYEYQKGSSRPDLVIKNIAIELKGPTDNAALDTLTTKCLKYSKYYDHLIIVLFEPRFSEGHFKEIKEGINQYFPHVIIIRK